MQSMNEHIEYTTEDISCDKCGNAEGTFINLECDHIFCLLCATFMYVKSRKSIPQDNLIKCIKCQSVSDLHEEYIAMINQTLENQVLPNLDSIANKSVSNNGKSVGYRYVETISRKIKSEEHSFEHHGTPSTNKCFFSKCESPSTKKRKSHPHLTHYCNIHTSEVVTHLCFTCSLRLVCLRCVPRHSGHEIKEIHKAFTFLSEQLSETNMDINRKIGEMELIQRRLDDRSIVIKDRGTKFMVELKDGFAELFQKLEQREQELIKTYQNHFAGLIEEINEENQKISCSIDLLKNSKEKIAIIQRSSNQIDLFSNFMELKSELNHLLQNKFCLHEKNKIEMPSSAVARDITELAQMISSIAPGFKITNLCRIGVSDLENCTSEGKICRDFQSKRIKTNFVSLNSSREKRDKKPTKTEEDERRLMKNQKINKVIDRNSKNKLPTYINDFINKRGTQCFDLEMASNNFQNTSKITSKLSKTISPEMLARKKKDRTTVIKERIERKTTQPSLKPRSKKKKVH